jgi:hydroxymethylglutaryl-CoA lyase
MKSTIKIVECSRDAMQGFSKIIPTDLKVEYINSLIEVGFDTIDCGSFVSAKAVPQLSDTSEVLSKINKVTNNTKLLSVVANEKGAETACSFDNIDLIGFPFSISETFQLRNTRQTTSEAFMRLKAMQKIALQCNKEFLVYLSMGFGNPYNDDWSIELAIDWCKKIADEGVTLINLSDTIGVAQVTDIKRLFEGAREIDLVEFGGHFHTRPDNYHQNLQAAYQSGCRKFDAAIQGFGGCPFAADKLTGNLPTELLLSFLDDVNESTGINKDNFSSSFELASKVFE